jgi:alkanesulfonate monooxygenase SsuD/methylene tetrahydromethanopterin reductase-like flavin-dependent oxidoreductase (luciferase family)
MRGAIVAGTAADVAADLQEFADRGMNEVILDLRLRPDAYEESLHQISEEVLPRLRRP